MSEVPERIQRNRTKGWRMPEDAVYVGRPTKWGNPWTPDMCGSAKEAVRGYALLLKHDPYGDGLAESARAELAGKDLACWCPLDQPCHADVLLEIANSNEGE